MERFTRTVVAGLASVLPLSPALGAAYIGFGSGESEIDVDEARIEEAFAEDDDFVATGTRVDTTDTGWKVYVGYRFTDFFAIEGGWVELGEAEFTTTIVEAPFPVSELTPFQIDASAEVRAVNLVGVLRLPLGEQLGLFAKAGAFAWKTEFEERIAGTGITRVSLREEGTDTTYGAGVEVGLGGRLRVRAEWERFQEVGKGIAGREGIDVDLATLGLSVEF